MDVSSWVLWKVCVILELLVRRINSETAVEFMNYSLI